MGAKEEVKKKLKRRKKRGEATLYDTIPMSLIVKQLVYLEPEITLLVEEEEEG